MGYHPTAEMIVEACQGADTWQQQAQTPRKSHSARGRVPGINSQTPRRRLNLFWGVCFFRHIFVNFRAFCLEVLGNFVYLQSTKGVAIICSPLYI